MVTAPSSALATKLPTLEARLVTLPASSVDTPSDASIQNSRPTVGTTPAIQINNDWSYVTDEEYLYYNMLLEVNGEQDGDYFIETLTPVELVENTYYVTDHGVQESGEIVTALANRYEDSGFYTIVG